MVNVENGALQAAINNAAVGETVVLTGDINLTNRVSVSNVVTIDLNGYSITGAVNDSYGMVYVGTKGALTITDSSAKKTGGITNTAGHAIGNYGSVIIYGGTFTGNYALYNFFYSNSVYGTAEIHGGTFKTCDGGELAIANCGELTIDGGTVESIDTTNVLKITGGDIASLNVGVADYGPAQQDTAVSGGHIATMTVEENSDNKVVVSGGTFDTAVDAKYLSDGYKLIYNESTGTFTASASRGFTVVATSSSRIRNLPIKDGQLIFIQNMGRIAFDFKGVRKFYNQIVEVATEKERQEMAEPMDGYYFVIDTAVLWAYKDGWTPITERPDEIIFIGVELPELGQAGKLYIDKEEKEISVWDEDDEQYIAVSNYTDECTDADIENLFK